MADQNKADQIVHAAAILADAVNTKQTLEDNRIHVKMDAIDRIMASGDNPATGKAWSFSAAEAVVNTDEEYADYLAQIRDAVREEIIARGAYMATLVGLYTADKDSVENV